MKHILRIPVLILTLLFNGSLFAQEIIINAKVNGLKDNSSIYLVKNKLTGGPDTIATTKSNNQQFSIQASVESDPNFYFVKIEGKNEYLTIFSGSETIDITGKEDRWQHAVVTGSKVNNEYHFLLKTIKEYRRDFDSIRLSLNTAVVEQNAVKYDTLKKQEEVVIENYYQKYRNLLEKYPSYLASAYFLYRLDNTHFEELSKIFKKLSPSVRQSRFGLLMSDKLTAIKSKRELSLVNKVSDICLPELNNSKKSTLYEFISDTEITLIDFWASWCGPCRKENIFLKQAAQKYGRPKFQIIGISLDTKMEKWAEAVKQDSLHWIQLSDLKGWNSAAVSVFDLKSLPSSILVDREGKILELDIRGSRLIDTLDNLLSQGKN